MLRNRVLPVLAAGLLALLVLWVLLAPAETRLGNLVKLVYVHGALAWIGPVVFSIAGLLGLGSLVAHYLLGSARQAEHWYLGTEAASLAALIVWSVYVISAMAVTGLTWGQLVAWNEPRVRAVGLILLAAIVLNVATRLVAHRDFTAVVSVLMGIVPWVVIAQADVLRHPVDPIGRSGSTAIQIYYWLIALTVAGLVATLIAWLWVKAELRSKAEEEG
jgi:hypothetical protein